MITSARNPVWANAQHTILDLMVAIGGAEMPFSASASDTERAGRELFESAVRGDFGVIAPYVPPVEPPAQESTSTVPQSVTRFQAKAALSLMTDREGTSQLSNVETYIAAKADALTKLAWTEALSFIRTSPMVLAVAAMLELTETQLDDLFIFASTIE